MKDRNITPTHNERLMRNEDFILSKTDLKGRITYGNRIFFEFSGYSEAELLGTQHNIVRHPDMPRGVFKFLWDTIQAKRECFAYVKNMSKDGGFYWVFTNVTPSLDEQGNIEGYLSVRRKPRREAIDVVTSVYKDMLQVEQRAGPKEACNASLALLTDLLAKSGVDYESFILSI
jgi:PAS domain S-box-containing protein